MKKIFLFLIIAVPIMGLAQSKKSSDLFVAGTLNTHTFQTPSLEVTTGGTVIAVCDARRDRRSLHSGNIDLYMRRSLDDGASWEAAKAILDLPQNQGCMNPSLLVDRITGRIFCFYTHVNAKVSPSINRAGKSGEKKLDSQSVKYIFSDDDGESWSQPVALNTFSKSSLGDNISSIMGHGIQTRSGRLMQPLSHSCYAYSDNHGHTWMVNNLDELKKLSDSDIVNYNNGVIVAHDRKVKAIHYSSIWEGQPYNVLVSGSMHGEKRLKTLSIRLSFDGAQTWPISIPIHKGASANFSMIRLYDGGLGVLLENGTKSPNQKISFVKIKKADIDSLIKSVPNHERFKRPRFSAYYYHRSHQFGLLPDTKDEIIFLGNSITDGLEWSELFGDERLKNRGISGDVTDGVLLRLSDITKLKPAQIFLLIGINDLAHGKSTKQVIENHRKIYAKIKKESPLTQLFVESVLPVNNYFGSFRGHTNKGDSIAVVNIALRKMAHEMGHTFIDLHSKMKDNQGKLRRDLTEDGLHLNGRGYQVWQEVIKDYIQLNEQ